MKKVTALPNDVTSQPLVLLKDMVTQIEAGTLVVPRIVIITEEGDGDLSVYAAGRLMNDTAACVGMMTMGATHAAMCIGEDDDA